MNCCRFEGNVFGTIGIERSVGFLVIARSTSSRERFGTLSVLHVTGTPLIDFTAIAGSNTLISAGATPVIDSLWDVDQLFAFGICHLRFFFSAYR